MSKKEDFKTFASKNKFLYEYVKSGKGSWQELYETYDIYGEDSDVWASFKSVKKEDIKIGESVKSVLNNLKNVDLDKLEDNIGSLQKALGFLEEIVLTRSEKKEEKRERKKSENTIERFFDD